MDIMGRKQSPMDSNPFWFDSGHGMRHGTMYRNPWMNGYESQQQVQEAKDPATIQKELALYQIEKSYGKPAGALKVKAGKTATLRRHAVENVSNVRNNVGAPEYVKKNGKITFNSKGNASYTSDTLSAGTVVNYYLVDEKETTNNRY